MGKKLSIIAVSCAIILETILLILLENNIIKFNKSYKIYIKNDTNTFIEDLEIKYKNGDIIKSIEQIKAKKSWKDEVLTSNIKGEDSIILVYKDCYNNYHEEVIVKYLKKGYSGRTTVTINNIDKNGKLNISIK